MNKVSDNKLESTKKYFFKELSSSYDFDEIKQFFQLCCEAWLGLSKTDLMLNPNKELSESEILLFLYGIKDLKKNRPIQYITGKSYFFGLELNVKEGVLIPRPETEELVKLIVDENPNANSILDIGTGSGCIALALKNQLKNTLIHGLDVSLDALKQARANAEFNKLEINFLDCDILNQEVPLKNKVDVIVSNPPYITESEKNLMHENVLDYEPHLALFVPDDDPLKFYKIISEKSKKLLSKCGKIYFEINENFGEKLCNFLSVSGFSEVELIKDLQGKDRIIKATLKDE